MWRPVLAELDRSLDELAETLPPVAGDQASWLARTLQHWDGGSSVLVLEGRAYVSERFAGRDLIERESLLGLQRPELRLRVAALRRCVSSARRYDGPHRVFE